MSAARDDARLLALVEAAERGEEQAMKGKAEAADAAPLPPPKRLLDLPPATPLDYAVDRLFVAGAVNAVVGDGGAGKSTLLYAIAGAQAASSLALGDRIARPGAVLFVAGEDSADLVKNRVEAFAAGHGWDARAMLANLHIYDDGVNLDDPRWQARLREAVSDLKAVSAYFDPLVDLCGDRVEENSNTDAKRVTRFLRRLAQETATTPVLAMHVSKPAEGKNERKHRVRGATAWKNTTRSCWWVEPCGGGIELEQIKGNYVPGGNRLSLQWTITADPDHPLMWKAAHLVLDTAGDVVNADVLAILGYLIACKAPPSGREVEEAHSEHQVPRDRARAALGVCRTKGWAEAIAGPRRSQLWSPTEAGRARALLG